MSPGLSRYAIIVWADNSFDVINRETHKILFHGSDIRHRKLLLKNVSEFSAVNRSEYEEVKKELISFRKRTLERFESDKTQETSKDQNKFCRI